MRSVIGCGVLAAALVACGGSDGGPAADAGDGESPCGFEERWLPYQPGYTWSYRVVDLGTGEQASKDQRIQPTTEHPELGEVLVQVTEKASGATESFLRREGEALVRLIQEDYDQVGALERTSEYDPGQLRLDESAERTTAGATWEESYEVAVYDGAGTPVGTTARTDAWEVLATDAACDTPFGPRSCLHVRRVRTVGGLADKQYYFARGIGKVREIGGNQVEELVSCGN